MAKKRNNKKKADTKITFNGFNDDVVEYINKRVNHAPDIDFAKDDLKHEIEIVINCELSKPYFNTRTKTFIEAYGLYRSGSFDAINSLFDRETNNVLGLLNNSTKEKYKSEGLIKVHGKTKVEFRKLGSNILLDTAQVDNFIIDNKLKDTILNDYKWFVFNLEVMRKLGNPFDFELITQPNNIPKIESPPIKSVEYDKKGEIDNKAPVNPYPDIFKNGHAYNMFLELKKLTVKTKTIVADYSFIFHKMKHKDIRAINKSITEPIFIEFLNTNQNTGISVVKLPFKAPKFKEPIYTTVLDKFKGLI